MILAMDFWRSQASADDPRNAVLMMPPSLCLEEDQRRDENVCKKNGDDLFKYRDNEVRVSHVWEEGRISSMSGEVCMDKGMCKSQTARSPGSANVQAEKEWVIAC